MFFFIFTIEIHTTECSHFSENYLEITSNTPFTEGDPMKKFLIAGLGNIGPKYQNTRHNIGFPHASTTLAQKESLSWETVKAWRCYYSQEEGAERFLLAEAKYLYEPKR